MKIQRILLTLLIVCLSTLFGLAGLANAAPKATLATTNSDTIPAPPLTPSSSTPTQPMSEQSPLLHNVDGLRNAPRFASINTPALCDNEGSVSGVWTLAESPYVVTCDLTVPAGETLTIEPGVEVRFDEPYALLVHGQLQANGTADQMITFTRHQSTNWGGIRFLNSNVQNSIHYVIVEYALSDAGGVGVSDSTLTLSNSVIRHNKSTGIGGGAGNGGGVRILDSNVTIKDSQILSNWAIDDGGGIYIGKTSGSNNTNVNLINNVIAYNHARDLGGRLAGGGVQINVATVVGYNNTIVHNSTNQGAGGGGVAVHVGANIMLSNTIVYHNTGGNDSQIHMFGGGQLGISSSNVQGGYAGTGNIDVEPMFVDAANGDFRLQAESPVIDAGTSDADAPTTDIAGTPRPQGTTWDMGAYEFVPVPTNKSLVIEALAFDSDLSGMVEPTIDEIVAGSRANPDVVTVVIADQLGDDNTVIYVVENGMVTTVEGLPNFDGILDTTLTEYDMTNGEQLGHAIRWARDSYPADKTVFSYVGHGTFLAPETDYTSFGISDRQSSRDGLPPLPTKWRVTPSWTDETSNSLLTPYRLAQALDIATDGGSNPIDVVDIVHCFAASIETFYEVHPYAEVLTGSPHYAYYSPDMLGRVVAALDPTADAAQIADTILATYDSVIAEGDTIEGETIIVEHPRLMVAVEADKLPAIKTNWDRVSYYLMQDFDAGKLHDAYLSSAKYDSTFCEDPQDWQLDTPDALVDLWTFVDALSQEYGYLTDVGDAALDTVDSVTAAILTTYRADGLPWFVTDRTTPTWIFPGAGLSLLADLHGTTYPNDPATYLTWQTAYLTKAVTEDNPQPYAFIQGGFNDISWADAFQHYWESQDTQLEADACLPNLLRGRQMSDVAVTTLLSPRFVKRDSPVRVSTVISTSERVTSLPILIEVRHDDRVVLTETVTIDYLRTGEYRQIDAMGLYTPTTDGNLTVQITVNGAASLDDPDSTNNVLTWSRSIDPPRSHLRPTVTAILSTSQQWVNEPTLPLTIDVTPDAPNQLVAEIFSYPTGSNPQLRLPESAGTQRLDLNNPTLDLSMITQPGLVKVYVWARTPLGGMSAQPALVVFNYVPADATLPAGANHLFAFDAEIGDSFAVSLTATDLANTTLCLWEPLNRWMALCTTDGVLQMTSTKAGEYVIVLYSTASADMTYTLTGTRNGAPIRAAQTATWEEREQPELLEPIPHVPEEPPVSVHIRDVSADIPQSSALIGMLLLGFLTVQVIALRGKRKRK